jgi:RNA polymerase sigma-70 factor (ECF subfamily)
MSKTTISKESKKSQKSLQELGLAFYNERTDVSFTQVFHRMKPGLNKYLYELVQDHSTREVVIMNTFKNVWEKIHQYDPYYAFSTWVYRIAKNEALLSKRWSKRNYSLDAMTEMGINVTGKYESATSTNPDYEFFEPTAEEEMERLYKMVLNEIDNLPEVYKTVMIERELKKKDYAKIAKELDWPINTVRTRIRKGRQIIYDSINKKEPKLVEKYYLSEV